MADDSGPSMGTIIALVIVVLLCVAGYYFYMDKQSTDENATSTIKIQLPKN